MCFFGGGVSDTWTLTYTLHTCHTPPTRTLTIHVRTHIHVHTVDERRPQPARSEPTTPTLMTTLQQRRYPQRTHSHKLSHYTLSLTYSHTPHTLTQCARTDCYMLAHMWHIPTLTQRRYLSCTLSHSTTLTLTNSHKLHINSYTHTQYLSLSPSLFVFVFVSVSVSLSLCL